MSECAVLPRSRTSCARCSSPPSTTTMPTLTTPSPSVVLGSRRDGAVAVRPPVRGRAFISTSASCQRTDATASTAARQARNSSPGTLRSAQFWTADCGSMSIPAKRRVANTGNQEEWSRWGCFPTARLTRRLAECSRGCRGSVAVEQRNGAARALECLVLHRRSADRYLAALDQRQRVEPAQRKERCRSRRPRAGSPTRITVAALRSAVACSASTPRGVPARGTRAAPNRQRRSFTRSDAAE